MLFARALVLAMAATLVSACAVGFEKATEADSLTDEQAPGVVAKPANTANPYGGSNDSGPATSKDASSANATSDGGASSQGDASTAPKTDAGADSAAKDAAPDVQVVVGRWYQADNQNCPSFCSGKGLQNIASSDGAMCTSGELIPASAVGAISYNNNGCWPSCNAHAAPNGHSEGNNCYGDGQNHDGDNTDRTAGCFCK